MWLAIIRVGGKCLDAVMRLIWQDGGHSECMWSSRDVKIILAECMCQSDVFIPVPFLFFTTLKEAWKTLNVFYVNILLLLQYINIYTLPLSSSISLTTVWSNFPPPLILYYHTSLKECNVYIFIYFNTCTAHILLFCTMNQQIHNYFTNYHTPTCFDTIMSSSGSSQSVPCQVT